MAFVLRISKLCLKMLLEDVSMEMTNAITIYFCYKTGIVSLLTLSQNLDLSCKTDLDFWDSFRWRKFHLIPKFLKTD